MNRLSLSLLMLAIANSGLAQEVTPCGPNITPDAIVEPWEDHSRSFANGNVRLALLDLIEPAAGAFHLLVLSPPFDEMGQRQCSVISRDGAVGWVALDFAELQADYDPQRGLVFDLTGILFEPDHDFSNGVALTVFVNQATGDVSVKQRLGGE